VFISRACATDDGAETKTSIDVVVESPPSSFDLTAEAISQGVSDAQTSEDAQRFLGSVASLLSSDDHRNKRSAAEVEALTNALVAEAISTGKRQDITPGGLSRTASLFSLLTQLGTLPRLHGTFNQGRRALISVCGA
jgi:hypothetical protein